MKSLVPALTRYKASDIIDEAFFCPATSTNLF